jgi:hypothetical protein
MKKMEGEYFLGIVLWYRSDKKQGCICSLSGERFLFYEERLNLTWAPRPESVVWFSVVFYAEKGYNVTDIKNTVDDDLPQDDLEVLDSHLRTARDERITKRREAGNLPEQRKPRSFRREFVDTFTETGGIVYKPRFPEVDQS